MQVNVRRLQRLQQASDVLRRTSRFTTLAKRLQTQMAEVGDGSTGAVSQPKASESKINSAALDGRRSATPGLDHEGEKERSLAQAALTIAELCREFINATLMRRLISCIRRPFGDLARCAGNYVRGVNPNRHWAVAQQAYSAPLHQRCCCAYPINRLCAVKSHRRDGVNGSRGP